MKEYVENEIVDIRIFDAGKYGAVYQYLETGKLELVKNASVVSSATPERKVNYNRIVRLSGNYMTSYIKGTTRQTVEKNVEPLTLREV